VSPDRLVLCAALILAGCAHGDDPSTVPDTGEAVDLAGGTDGATAPDGGPVVNPEQTGPYPIILVHGLAGWARLGPVEYFAGVAQALTGQGRVVYAPALDMFNSSEARGQKLLETIEKAKLETGKAKVVLIGHSQGGLDSRWAAQHAGGAVAAVVTIGTPHHGTRIADIALGLTPGPIQDATSSLLQLVGGALDPQGQPDASLTAALTTLSTSGAAAFNAAVPDVVGVAYYSIAGRSANAKADDCAPSAAAFVAASDALKDPVDPLLWSSTGVLVVANLPGTPAHDGLLTVDSARWGTFLGCIPADHLNEICAPSGTMPNPSSGFDCVGFYVGLAGWLAQQGL
jgi:triacylglycerol lipase